MKPSPTSTHRSGPAPRQNETAMAIVVSLAAAAILATVTVGNPFRAMGLAYTDYSHTPAAGAAKASQTRAPASLNEGK